jgi:hypothetical protein
MEAARNHIAALMPRLQQRQVSDLFVPGLAYWRTIQVLDRIGETEVVARLYDAFREYVETILISLNATRREAFVTKIWYHAALLNK